MSVRLKERIQEVWSSLPASEQAAVLDFAEFLAHRRRAMLTPEACLSEEEHARVVAALDAVTALSQETGPVVSNRTHDVELYGKR
jgi:hypothetical protein